MTSIVETAGEIRPFHVDIPDAALEDLRRPVAATNRPERDGHGVPLAMIQRLARYGGGTTTGARPRRLTAVGGERVELLRRSSARRRSFARPSSTPPPAHGHEDPPELRQQVRRFLEPPEAYLNER